MLTRRGTVTRLMYDNLCVSADEIRETEKEMPPRFRCFEEYFDYVKTNYGLIAKNARDLHRREPMAIFSTQSRGYDRTATNAIAMDFGIDRVFTITKGKGAGRFADREGVLKLTTRYRRGEDTRPSVDADRSPSVREGVRR